MKNSFVVDQDAIDETTRKYVSKWVEEGKIPSQHKQSASFSHRSKLSSASKSVRSNLESYNIGTSVKVKMANGINEGVVLNSMVDNVGRTIVLVKFSSPTSTAWVPIENIRGIVASSKSIRSSTKPSPDDIYDIFGDDLLSDVTNGFYVRVRAKGVAAFSQLRDKLAPLDPDGNWIIEELDPVTHPTKKGQSKWMVIFSNAVRSSKSSSVRYYSKPVCSNFDNLRDAFLDARWNKSKESESVSFASMYEHMANIAADGGYNFDFPDTYEEFVSQVIGGKNSSAIPSSAILSKAVSLIESNKKMFSSISNGQACTWLYINHDVQITPDQYRQIIKSEILRW